MDPHISALRAYMRVHGLLQVVGCCLVWQPKGDKCKACHKRCIRQSWYQQAADSENEEVCSPFCHTSGP